MTKIKILNIKIGEVYIPELNKKFNVTTTAYPKKAKDGQIYYESKNFMFIKEIEIKDKEDSIDL